MDPFIHALYSLSYLFLFLWGVKLARLNGFFTLKNVLLLVTLGLIYDNLVLAIGRSIGEGTFLKSLNLMRYWIHALLTPSLVLFSWATVWETGLKWLSGKAALIISMVLTAVLMIVELVQNTLGIVIHPVDKYSILSYEPSASQGPPFMIIGVTITLLFAGLILWKNLKWKWMAIGVIIMGIGSAVPIPIESDAATNGFELILLISLWFTKEFLDKRQKLRSKS
jgi:hypothetical protein